MPCFTVHFLTFLPFDFFHIFFFLLIRRPPTSTLFLYTTLFRARRRHPAAASATPAAPTPPARARRDRKSTRLNSSHLGISYAVFCLKKKIRRHHLHVELLADRFREGEEKRVHRRQESVVESLEV